MKNKPVSILLFAFMLFAAAATGYGQQSRQHIERGIGLYKSDNFTRAGVEFRKGLEAISDPDSRIETVKLLNMMTTMFSSADEIILYRKYQSSMKDGDYDDAIEHAAKALELNPRNVLFYYSLAYAWKKDGNSEKAIQYLEEGRRIYPAYYPIMVQLTILYHSDGDTERTREMLYDYAFFLGLQEDWAR